MKYLFTILVILFSIPAFAQPSTLRDVTIKFTFGTFVAGGTGDFTGVLDGLNDQTNTYDGNDVAVGQIIWDNAGQRWEIVAVNTQNFIQADVDITSLDGAVSAPIGIGYLSKETPNYDFTLFVPDNAAGISQQLKSIAESHNWLWLDSVLTTIGGIDTLSVQDGVSVDLEKSGQQILTAEVILSDSSSNLVQIITGASPSTRNGVFVGDIQDTDIKLNKETLGISTNVGTLLDVLADSLHVHRDGNTVDFTLIQPANSQEPDTVTAEIIISPDADNLAEARANGLYVSGTGASLNLTPYNSGGGVWVYGEPGVVTTPGAPGTGIYNIDIPDTTKVISMYYEIDNSNDLSVGGEAFFYIDHNTSTYNTNFTNALFPNIMLIDGAGVQREPGNVIITVTHGTPTSGIDEIIISNSNGLGYPHRIMLKY